MNWVIFTKTKPTIQPINISFKVFTKQDIDSVLLIERLNYDFPWNKAQFIDGLNNPRVLSNLILKNNQILGYSITQYSIDSADLLNICIHPNHQHQGLGSALFDYLRQQLLQLGVDKIFIEVRQSNQLAFLFYQKIGFEVINTRKKYYSNGEDAKIMCFQIND